MTNKLTYSIDPIQMTQQKKDNSKYQFAENVHPYTV